MVQFMVNYPLLIPSILLTSLMGSIVYYTLIREVLAKRKSRKVLANIERVLGSHENASHQFTELQMRQLADVLEKGFDLKRKDITEKFLKDVVEALTKRVKIKTPTEEVLERIMT